MTQKKGKDNGVGKTIGELVREEIDQIFSRLAEDISAGKFGKVKDGTHVELFKGNTCLIAAWDRYLERDDDHDKSER